MGRWLYWIAGFQPARHRDRQLERHTNRQADRLDINIQVKIYRASERKERVWGGGGGGGGGGMEETTSLSLFPSTSRLGFVEWSLNHFMALVAAEQPTG